jgi:magnesium chelatase family protein
MLVEGLEVCVVRSLASTARVLAGGRPDPLPPATPPVPERRVERSLDLAEVRGCGEAVEALTIAAAGAHNLLLNGPPGIGKTMLAQRLPGILPELTREEAVEVLRIRSVAGAVEADALPRARPFRAPHHTITATGLVGGAHRGRLGEATLAHKGVLFLDELSEFSPSALQALRQPLEDGRVAIARARHSTVYPARFMLVAATNPCPCGYLGEPDLCHCGPRELARHRRRLSGPLLDRIDLLVQMRHRAGEIGDPQLVCSAEAHQRVVLARELQAARLRAHGLLVNAQMQGAALRECLHLDESAERLLAHAGERVQLSARGLDRSLRVARTIADLDGRARVGQADLARAFALRPAFGSDPSRPA